MQCECRKDLEQKMLENFKRQNPDAQDVSVSMAGYAFQLVGNGMRMVNVMPCKIIYKNTVKRTGQQKDRQKTINIAGNYCMFCGQKLST